eukprot:359817-Chlamydomonas_euryale.AAC.1
MAQRSLPSRVLAYQLQSGSPISGARHDATLALMCAVVVLHLCGVVFVCGVVNGGGGGGGVVRVVEVDVGSDFARVEMVGLHLADEGKRRGEKGSGGDTEGAWLCA